MDAFTPALDLLLSDGLLIESGVNGLYGRSGAFEDVLQRVEALTRTVAAQDGAMVMRFPPGMSRAAFERSGYIKNFPHLAVTGAKSRVSLRFRRADRDSV